jgi:lysine decarboxylase
MSSIDCCIEMLTKQDGSFIDSAIEVAEYGRKEICKIGLDAIDDSIVGIKGVDDWDKTKLSINVTKTGISGFKIKSILHEKYNIEIEYASIDYLLCFITAANTKENIDKLLNGLKEILLSNKSETKNTTDKLNLTGLNELPKQIFTPSETLYKSGKTVSLEEAVGKVSKNVITPYPPGIPYLCPGEVISEKLVQEFRDLKIKGAFIQGINHNTVEVINS